MIPGGGGKGSCDRKAATIKAHVKRFIDEGHDVLNAFDFKNAMLSHGGIRDVQVVVVDASTSRRTRSFKSSGKALAH